MPARFSYTNIALKSKLVNYVCKSQGLQPCMRKNGPFLSCCEPHYESEATCKVFVRKISFHSYANKTNFHVKSCCT